MLPQHAGKKSLDGTDPAFAEKVRGYLHTPWVQTALIADPRILAVGPADPPVIVWKISDGMDALFSGNAFGDGSCTKEPSALDQRDGPSERLLAIFGEELSSAVTRSARCRGHCSPRKEPSSTRLCIGCGIYARCHG